MGIMLFVFVSFGLIYLLIGSGGRDFELTSFLDVATYFFLLGVTATWVFDVVSLWKREQAGKLLLVIPRSQRERRLGIIFGTNGLLLVAIVVMSWIFDDEILPSGLGLAIWGVWMAFYFPRFYIENHKVQEKGIVISGMFLEWKTIQSFAWERDNPNTLILRRRRFLIPRISLPIPNDKKEALEQLLDTHLSHSDDTDGGKLA